jgi:hypothetical protein
LRPVDSLTSPCTRCCWGSVSDRKNSSSSSERLEEAEDRTPQKKYRMNNGQRADINKRIYRHTLNPINEQGTETLTDGRNLLRFPARTFNKICRKRFSREAEGRCSEPDALVPLTWVSGADEGLPIVRGRTREVADMIVPGQGPDAVVAAVTRPCRWGRTHGADAGVVSGLENDGLRDGHPGLVLDDLSAPVRKLPTNEEGTQLVVEPLGKVDEADEAVVGLGHGTSDGRVGGATHLDRRQSCDLAKVLADEASCTRSASQANGRLEVRVGAVEIRLVLSLARGSSELGVDQGIRAGHRMTKAAQGDSSCLEASVLPKVIPVRDVEIMLGDLSPDPGSGHEGGAPEDVAEELGGDAGFDVHGRGSGGENGVNTESRIGEGERPERESERKKAQKKVVETRNLTQNVTNRTEWNGVTVLVPENSTAARESHNCDLPEDTIPDRDGPTRVGQSTELKEAQCGKARSRRPNAVRRGEQLRVDRGTQHDRRREKRRERATQTR